MRRAEGAYVVEGPRPVEEALDAGAPIEALYWAAGAPPALVERAGAAGVPVFELAGGVMERVADAVTPQPVLAVARMRPAVLADLRRAGLLVVGVGVQDPGNAGAILRSARAAGADGVVWCGPSVDLFNPKTVRAAAGALFRMPVVVDADLDQVLGELGGWGVRRLAAVAEGGRDYAAVDLTGRVALIFGNEARGLSPGERAGADDLVSVPMAGGSESLNVAMAATAICFEAARQRRLGGAAHREVPAG